MKNKSATLDKGNRPTTPRKDARQSSKIVHKKLVVKRTSIKLRASTEKCVAKRTRDKSTKKPTQASSSSTKYVSCASEKNTSGSNKILATCKPKYLIQAKSGGKLNHVNKKATVKNKGIMATKANINRKENVKKKVIKHLSSDEFFDIWAFVSIGKREASLNASMKVNIMFEKHSPLKSSKAPPKKTETAVEQSSQSGSVTNKICDKGKVSVESNSIVKCKKTQNNNSVKEPSCHKGKEGETSKQKSCQKVMVISEKIDGRKSGLNSKHTNSDTRKRKCPGNKLCKEESSAKVPKIEKKNPVKQKKKVAQQTKKRFPSGHYLCNIIEKSPRQASLVAKAMIAMEQEDDTIYESSARTQVYDWMELRSHTLTDSRRIRWCNGLGISIKKKVIKNIDDNQQLTKDDEAHLSDVDVSSESVQSTTTLENESIHSTLLRTLHHIGDSRLLKEYLRAQKEDFQGPVDVEKCATPAEKQTSPPDPKKDAVVDDEKIEKILEKPVSCSLAKPQPCRVVTPIPQFPAGQRTSNFTSIIHNPIAQPIYPQKHSHIHPQPIKVTPYPTSPSYIYQYTMDRPQNKTYAPTSSSPILYGMSSSEAANRDYPSPFTFNHLGRLGLERSVSQYQPAAYTTPLHLPIQQIGYNYRTYYPTAIHALPQQTMPALQTLPVHQQYPVVRAPVVTRQISQDVGQLMPYQHGYPSYPPLPSLRQAEGRMPPPLAPAHRRPPMVHPGQIRQPPLTGNSFHPMESLRSLNPVEVQPIVSSPAVDFSPDFIHHQSNLHKQFSSLPSCRPSHQQFINHPCKGPSNSNYSTMCDELNKSFSLCKKEQEDVPITSCDVFIKSSMCSNECLPLSSGSSRTSSECSDVSDLLHSAHSTMYQIEGVNSLENMREFQQAQVSVSCDSSMRNASPFKISVSGHTSFSASYSVSSILDMPSCKVKTEPENKNSPVSQSSDLVSVTGQNTLELPATGCSMFVCLASVGSNDESYSKESNNVPVHRIPQKSETSDPISIDHKLVKTEEGSGKSKSDVASVIIIEDSDGSSDDEPLAKLKSKSCDNLESQSTEVHAASIHMKVDVISEPPKQFASNAPAQHSGIKAEETSKPDSADQPKLAPNSSKIKKSTSFKLHNIVNAKNAALKPHSDRLSQVNPTQTHCAIKDGEDKSQCDTEAKKSASNKSSACNSPRAKKPAHKIKAQPEWHLTSHGANTNHGWTWIGEGQMKPIPKVSLGREEPVRIRRCYKSMQHTSGEIVSVRDCVILHSDGDGMIPYVAKVSALWENLNGEMMFSMLWYYQPEHTAVGRNSEDGEQELFASKHREENSVACIDDKCFVLMYNEYCRLEAEGVRQEQGVTLPKWRELMPEVTADDKELCRLPPPANACADNIWFCRYDYDFRKKIVKKPKHKKSNLRYRTPCKTT